MLYPLDHDAPPKNTETCNSIGINIISRETRQAGTECQVPLEAAWVLVSRVWQQIPDSPNGKKVKGNFPNPDSWNYTPTVPET